MQSFGPLTTARGGWRLLGISRRAVHPSPCGVPALQSLWRWKCSVPWCHCGWSPVCTVRVSGAGTLRCWWRGCATPSSRPRRAACAPGTPPSGAGPLRSPCPSGCRAPAEGCTQWGTHQKHPPGIIQSLCPAHSAIGEAAVPEEACSYCSTSWKWEGTGITGRSNPPGLCSLDLAWHPMVFQICFLSHYILHVF